MSSDSPLVTVLITTFNRCRLLPRAIKSVLAQDFVDFELIIIDDCSTDETNEVVGQFVDSRIRYIRNDRNLGAEHGDRTHVRRVVYELMRGRYFVYLCDDDYWIPKDLLSRQVAAFREHPDLAMAMGGQLSHVLMAPAAEQDPDAITPETLPRYFDVARLVSTTPDLSFAKNLYSQALMTSQEFLEAFAADPAGKNQIVGAVLYARDAFVRSRTLAAPVGSKWQAGYELFVGPASAGGVYYFNEPAVLTEIRPTNASFQRTQVDHYLDSIKSAEIAFAGVTAAGLWKENAEAFERIRRTIIRNLTRSFLYNGVAIKRYGTLTLCSEENMSRPVDFRHALAVFFRNGIWPNAVDLKIMFLAPLKARLARRLDALSRRWTLPVAVPH